MVSSMSSACAIATLVPTPSVEVASSGRSYVVSAEASKRPAKPPRPPTTSGRGAFATHSFISSIGLVAGLDVDAGGGVGPLARLVTGSGRLGGVGQPGSCGSAVGQGLLSTGSALPAEAESETSSRCLRSRLSSGSGIGYSPVKQARRRLAAGCPVDSIIPSREM